MARLLMHATVADTSPHTDRDGGTWTVACLLCGWERVGAYLFSQNEPEALAVAHVVGTTHEHRHNKTHARGRTT